MVHKPTARQALERPYQGAHERSVKTAMSRGEQPKGLAALVRWFRERCDEELPVAIHRGGVWRDFGPDAVGASALGAPADTDAFRRFVYGADSELDEDGYYRKPLRAALARMSRRWPFMARHLYRLALLDGDWRRHAEGIAWQYEEVEVYMTEALYRLWREYQEGRVVS